MEVDQGTTNPERTALSTLGTLGTLGSLDLDQMTRATDVLKGATAPAAVEATEVGTIALTRPVVATTKGDPITTIEPRMLPGDPTEVGNRTRTRGPLLLGPLPHHPTTGLLGPTTTTQAGAETRRMATSPHTEITKRVGEGTMKALTGGAVEAATTTAATTLVVATSEEASVETSAAATEEASGEASAEAGVASETERTTMCPTSTHTMMKKYARLPSFS